MDRTINEMKTNDGEVKSQRLEFDDEKSFMRQLLITDKAKKSLIKPKIEAGEAGLNLGLIGNVKKFLEDAKREKGESKNGDQAMKSRFGLENDDLCGPSLPENEEYSLASSLEIGSLDKQQLGVEFDLLMYEEDSESDESDEES